MGCNAELARMRSSSARGNRTAGPSTQRRAQPHSLTSLPDLVQGTNRVVLKVSGPLAMLTFTMARTSFLVKDHDDFRVYAIQFEEIGCCCFFCILYVLAIC